MTIRDTDVQRALGSGLAALVALQKPDGSFPITAYCRRPPVLTLDPIFSTASVLIATGQLLPKPTVTAALGFIAARRRRDGLWEWNGCPADADDTAMCLAALIGSGWANGSEAATLRQFWRGPSGPFRTWQVGFGKESLPDDPVVNCNVLYCLTLGSVGISEPEGRAVSEFAITSVKSAEHYSAYYSSITTLLYAAARAHLDASVLTSLLTALRIETLDHQGIAELIAALPNPKPDLIERLLSAQRSDGSWAGTPWFFDYAGDFCSDAYATAVALEALSL